MKENFFTVIKILIAFISTSVIMTAFEYTNSLFFPFPEGLDTTSLDEVQKFSASLPDTAVIMILLGWFFGTLLGLKVLSKFNFSEKTMYVFVGFLTILAIGNNYFFIGLENKVWFHILTIPFFFLVSKLFIIYFK